MEPTSLQILYMEIMGILVCEWTHIIGETINHTKSIWES
jgi:hypothetical protein